MSEDPFRSIRPYRDSEVQAVLASLVRNEELVSALSGYQFPGLMRWLPGVAKSIVRMGLARQFGDVEGVRDFQNLVADYFEKMIGKTTTRLTCEGIDQLDPEESYLFISNHRDIAMDPAFLNWVRHQYGYDTVRIAIGDNLLKKDYVSDLMRLNKSFIVNRSAKAPREMMAAMTQLSEYIDFSLQQDGQSIWIAQREGRAKDGNDRTDPAMLKMLFMSHRKAKRSFPEAMARLNIVPVSISYEYDPCDYLKANELYSKETQGSYQKGQFEDIESIVEGIKGFKGHVHIAFGQPITEGFETPDELAALIDQQILSSYYLHPSNYLAAGETAGIAAEKQAEFAARRSRVMAGAEQILEKMYANPVINQRGVDAE